MMIKLEVLAQHLKECGMPAAIEGDPSIEITAVHTLEDATSTEISFLANLKYEKLLATTRAAAVIVGNDVATPQTLTILRTSEPYCAIRHLIVLLHGHRKHPDWGTHPSASISQNARVGQNANIAPNVTIEAEVIVGDHVVLYPGCYIGRGCRLGDHVTLYANVAIYEDTIIGHNVSIHSGTVIGEDGLGYAPDGELWRKFPHVGKVLIEDDVEIGANCTVDRAMLGTTVIGKGAKFSNLIAIGHGTKIGENAMFVAQVGLAGSVTVGRHVKMGGQAGIVGHVAIGDNANIGAKAGVASDVEPEEFVLGQPAIKASEAKRVFSITQKLPDMMQRLRAVEAKVLGS